MKRLTALLITVAAVIGTSYAGTTSAANTDSHVTLTCGADVLQLTHNDLVFRGVKYWSNGGARVMEFHVSDFKDMPQRESVVLTVYGDDVYLIHNDEPFKCVPSDV